MRTAKEYRRIAWNAIRPHWRVMLLISLAAVLPQLIEFFLQLLFGLIPPIDMQFWFSDPSRFLAAYDAFVVQTLAPNLLLNVLFNCLSVPLTLGLIGAAQRLLRGEDVQVRHSLTYVPYSLRAIGLEIRIVLYAFWPLLALAAVTLVLLLIFHSHGVYQLFRLASLAAIAFGVTRLYSMAAAKYLMAKKPTLRVSDLMETSRTIMEDRRLNLFLLELSFAGWGLPMILVCAAVLLLVGYNAYVVCVLLLRGSCGRTWSPRAPLLWMIGSATSFPRRMTLHPSPQSPYNKEKCLCAPRKNIAKPLGLPSSLFCP